MSNNITQNAPLEWPFNIADEVWQMLPQEVQNALFEGWLAKRRQAAGARLDRMRYDQLEANLKGIIAENEVRIAAGFY